MSALGFVADVKCGVGSGSDRDRGRAVHRKPDIGVWLLHGCGAAPALPQHEAISKLRRACKKPRGRSPKIDNVRPRVRIHKIRIRLAHQNVAHLGIEMAEAWRRRSVPTEEIHLHEQPCRANPAYGNAKIGRETLSRTPA